jgi:NAD(P)-dependent dehydrogenase (short-subunit alcohol dehydrogenase family)
MAWFRCPADPAVLVSGLVAGHGQFRVIGRQRREVHAASVTGSLLPWRPPPVRAALVTALRLPEAEELIDAGSAASHSANCDDGGRLDGAVNNAGVARGGPLEYLPLEICREQLEVNVPGQVAVTKAVLPFIRAARGRIVFIGSIGGKAASMLSGHDGRRRCRVNSPGRRPRRGTVA